MLLVSTEALFFSRSTSRWIRSFYLWLRPLDGARMAYQTDYFNWYMIAKIEGVSRHGNVKGIFNFLNLSLQLAIVCTKFNFKLF